MPLMQVKMVKENGHFFTGHRCICSLPKNIPRISRETIFVIGIWNRQRKFQLRPICLTLVDLGAQFLSGLHSLSGADITGTVA